MYCPTQLTWSTYVDGGLPAAAAAELERHVQGCASCAALVAQLGAENRLLRNALTRAEHVVEAPAFRQPLGSLARCGVALGALLTAAMSVAYWETLLEQVPSQLSWLNPFTFGEAWSLTVELVLFLADGGFAMIVTSLYTFAFAVGLALLAGVVFRTRKSRAGSAALLSVALAIVVAPSLGHALEVRRDQALVTVRAGETIDDTLVVAGDTVSIDGNINGDLIAFCRSLSVRGNVTGNVVAFAQTVNVEGGVTGSIYGFGRTVDLAGAQVGRNFFGFGSGVTVGTGASVGSNATMFANIAAVRGRVGTDVTSFSSELEVAGEVVRNVTAHAGRIRVLDAARIGGALTAYADNADNVQTAAGATIAGATDVRVDEEERERAGSRYLSASFYVRQAIRLGAAFVAGLLLFWLFPGLGAVTLDSASRAVKAAGIGLVTAVMLPIACVLIGITIIGIPLGIVGFVSWLLGLYLAKIVVAFLIGRRLFAGQGGPPPHNAALLISGLVVILIAVNIPFVGGIVNILLTIVGLGLLVSSIFGRYEGRLA